MKIEKVNGTNRKNIPEDGADISEVVNIEYLIEFLESINIWYRGKESCPFARGNWLIDLTNKFGETYCIKLPKEMTEQAVMKYAQPLLDRFKEKKSEHEH